MARRGRGGGSAWKWVGLAGLAGVAASGVVVARAERQRRAYTPDAVRDRLPVRAAEAAADEQAAGSGAPASEPPTTARRRYADGWKAARARTRAVWARRRIPSNREASRRERA